MIIQRKTHDRRRCECRTIVSNISILFDIAYTYKLRVFNHLQNFLQLKKFITIKNKGFHFRAYMYIYVYKRKKPLGMKIKWLSVEFFNFRGYVILIHFYYLSLILTRLLSNIRHAFTLLCKAWMGKLNALHDHCPSALVLSQTPVNDRPVTASVPVPRHHSNTDDPLPLKQ